MDEEDLLLLASEGFTYNDAGYMLDSEGNFIDTVTIGDKTFNSILTLEGYNHRKAKETNLKDLGFEVNPNIGASTYRQEEEFLARHYINEHIKSPNDTPLKRNGYSKYVYEDMKQEGLVSEDNIDLFEANYKGIKQTVLKVDSSKDKTELPYNNFLLFGLIILIVIIIRKIPFRYFKESKLNVKYYLITSLFSLLSGGYLGFRFKTLGSYLLRKAESRTSEWKKDIFISRLKSEHSFFKLKISNAVEGYGFEFNWEVFFISIFLIMLVSVLLKETKYFEIIKSKFKK